MSSTCSAKRQKSAETAKTAEVTAPPAAVNPVLGCHAQSDTEPMSGTGRTAMSASTAQASQGELSAKTLNATIKLISYVIIAQSTASVAVIRTGVSAEAAGSQDLPAELVLDSTDSASECSVADSILDKAPMSLSDQVTLF